MEHLLKRAEGPDKRPESITDRLREGGSRVALGD
jgi:hypothetical protein